MNNQPSDAGESLWRKQLSEAERANLRAQPELEIEARLTDALAKIPDAPVPSNFTARVLNAVELEESRASRHAVRRLWRVWVPRLAVSGAVLIFAAVGLQHYEAYTHRVALAKNVAMIATKQPLPSVDALVNLDIIQKMGASNHADGDLLAALQ